MKDLRAPRNGENPEVWLLAVQKEVGELWDIVMYQALECPIQPMPPRLVKRNTARPKGLTRLNLF